MHRAALVISVLLTGFLDSTGASAQQNQDHHNARIVWNPGSRVLIQPGGVYGRMMRTPSREILCSFEWGGSVYVRVSSDEGRTWDEPVRVASFDFGSAANPEMLVLQDGTILRVQ